MQLFVLLAILAGLSALSVGFLGNDIKLWMQDYGVGDGDIPTPIMTSNLKILITRVNTATGFDDLITGCEFTSVDKDLLSGTTLYCKLFQGPDVRTAAVIATGFKQIDPPGLLSNTPTTIDITDKSFLNSNDVTYVENVAVEIQNPPQ